MRVLQLIDSLDAGGAERVAVNYANGLLNHCETSFLCTTRKEGLLKKALHKNVQYLYLNRTKTFDFKALFKLKDYIKHNKISTIHAHSTSIFTAVLVKIIGAKVKIVWHDHYGKSEYLNERPKAALKFCSYFINHVFAVNDRLEEWSKTVLNIKSSRYIPNFVAYKEQNLLTKLGGEEGKRIVCLANLRHQKDHLNLLKAFSLLLNDFPEWTLHLVGKDFNDEYSNTIKSYIIENNLNTNVFIYGSCNDTFAILKQCDVGVLSSKSEGLPLALLEYGILGLPVVSTNVGDCNKVITDNVNGLLVSAQNSDELRTAISVLIHDVVKSKKFGQSLFQTVTENFLEEVILQQVITTYKKL